MRLEPNEISIVNREEILDTLLTLKAIHISEAKPFQWASGWLSPIYCDNRLLLSSHEAREKICNSLVALVKNRFARIDGVVGVATGAIAMGVLVADRLQLPFAYVRPAPKQHGMGNQIEGRVEKGAKVVVVEDLVSTGRSSLAAVKALREAGAVVEGMVSIFTYDFPQASEAFRQQAVPYYPLASYPTLLEMLKERGEINEQQLELLTAWRNTPEEWRG